MGDEADADWEAGLIELGREMAAGDTRLRRPDPRHDSGTVIVSGHKRRSPLLMGRPGVGCLRQ